MQTNLLSMLIIVLPSVKHYHQLTFLFKIKLKSFQSGQLHLMRFQNFYLYLLIKYLKDD